MGGIQMTVTYFLSGRVRNIGGKKEEQTAKSRQAVNTTVVEESS